MADVGQALIARAGKTRILAKVIVVALHAAPVVEARRLDLAR
jgi:hypothetical protein